MAYKKLAENPRHDETAVVEVGEQTYCCKGVRGGAQTISMYVLKQPSLVYAFMLSQNAIQPSILSTMRHLLVNSSSSYAVL